MPSVEDTHLRNRFRIQPNDSNSYGTAHGGSVMKWLDEVGAMAAMRFSGETCVTARMGAIDFGHPVPVGDTVLIDAYVFDAGETSVHVHLTSYHEDPRTGETTETSWTTTTYVAVDADGDPTSVPTLTVDSERGEELRAVALEHDDA